MRAIKHNVISTAATLLRRLAEEKLQSSGRGTAFAHGDDETLRLVHELEVHQVELEMQNDELRKTQQELEFSRNKYLRLFESAPIGYFTFDLNGVIVEVNGSGAELLGVESDKLKQRRFADFLSGEEGMKAFADHLYEVGQASGVKKCEIALRGEPQIHGLFQSVKVEPSDGGEAFVLTSIVDGTLGKQLGDALQEDHDRLEAMVAVRTSELTGANQALSREIKEHEEAAKSLNSAIAEIRLLKERLLAENRYLLKEVSLGNSFGEMIGQSSGLTQVFTRVKQVAPMMSTTVLVMGETGTGKGLVARAIHNASPRSKKPMITVNCTSLPANLIESELFGREKGAFTGATAKQIGRFELADGSTIFLDEIGEMHLGLQSKLLRVIQDGEFERLGSPRTVQVDVRIIAASNRNLEEEVRKGRFREDLFYRLNVFPIDIPPLRQRVEDIPMLVDHFVSKFNKKLGKRIEKIPRDQLAKLQDYNWPGNVRELESVIERAVITSQHSTLQILDHLECLKAAASKSKDDASAMADIEKDHILSVLQKTAWRIEGPKGAAAILELNPSTLRARMRKHDIRRH